MKTAGESVPEWEPVAVGGVTGGGSCAFLDAGQTKTLVWAMYWTGSYDSRGIPLSGLVITNIISREGRDGVAAAPRVTQMMLDRMSESYAEFADATLDPSPSPSSR